MQRWGQIKGSVNYQKITQEVFLTTDAARLMKEAGLTPPTMATKSFTVMGKPFDPSKAAAYARGFKIGRAG